MDSKKMFIMLPAGYFISCLASTPQVALAISAPLIIPVLLFGGFFLQNGSVPVYLDWLRYLSWFMYGNEALSVNQWYNVTFENPDCQYVGYNTTFLENLPDQTPEQVVNATNFLLGLYKAYEENVACSGEDILNIYNFNPVRKEGKILKPLKKQIRSIISKILILIITFFYIPF